MTTVGRLKENVVRAGLWGASSRPVRFLTAATGLQGRFHELYWRRQFERHDGTCTRAVNGVEVVFHAGTPDEFRHCKTLMDEGDVLEDVVAHVEPDDVFFDVGAYLGVYTCFVCASHPSVRTVAFEPDPNRQALLHRNVEENDLDAEIHEYVLSDAPGTASFATSGEGGPNVSHVATGEHDGTIEVEQATVDDLVERGEVPPPNVVKVDVEGGEFDALSGMRETLGREECRVVYCEVHPTLLPSYGATEEGIVSLLAERGFAVERIGERGHEFHLRATKAPESGGSA